MFLLACFVAYFQCTILGVGLPEVWTTVGQIEWRSKSIADESFFRQPWNKDISFAVAWESKPLPILYQGQVNISSSSFCRVYLSHFVNYISDFLSTAFFHINEAWLNKPACLVIRCLFEFASDSVSVFTKINKNINEL